MSHFNSHSSLLCKKRDSLFLPPKLASYYDFFCFLNKCKSWPTFYFTFVLISSQFKFKLKKRRCCTWESNPGCRMVGADRSTELRQSPLQ